MLMLNLMKIVKDVVMCVKAVGIRNEVNEEKKKGQHKQVVRIITLARAMQAHSMAVTTA